MRITILSAEPIGRRRFWLPRDLEADEVVFLAVFGRLELMADLPHDTVEPLPDGGAIIRKGSVKLRPGEMTVIPSHL